MKQILSGIMMADKQCSITKFMRKVPTAVDESTSVAEVTQLMVTNGYGAILTTSAGVITGIFTERDLLTRVVAQGLNPATTAIGEVCSSCLISISDDASCQDAILKMRANQCRRLLVYNGPQLKGLLELPEIANSIAANVDKREWFLNLIVGITLTLVIIVIVLLILSLPEMLNIAHYNINKPSSSDYVNPLTIQTSPKPEYTAPNSTTNP
ncbi:hypothetical protein TI05_10330 [Achromatium sp. WMS3]|nr:hypothetical protein TI05_10330 [Achromatium sp. WMS3]